jgi:hypothetical protein
MGEDRGPFPQFGYDAGQISYIKLLLERGSLLQELEEKGVELPAKPSPGYFAQQIHRDIVRDVICEVIIAFPSVLFDLYFGPFSRVCSIVQDEICRRTLDQMYSLSTLTEGGSREALIRDGKKVGGDWGSGHAQNAMPLMFGAANALVISRMAGYQQLRDVEH